MLPTRLHCSLACLHSSETLLARVLSSGEKSSDEVEGEASEKLDFFKTYSSRTELQEDMATLARESRPANSGTACESNLSHIAQANLKGHPALPMLS